MSPRIIGLWSTPRSVSTAFEKTFSQRDDTVIVHEPFTDCYYFGPERRSNRYGDQEGVREYTGRQAIEEIEQYKAPLIFFKELAFQAVHYIDPIFLSKVSNTFIVRDPREVLASLYILKPDFSEEEFGFKPLLQIYQMVTQQCEQEPFVVEANKFRWEPKATLMQYCQKLGIDFDDRMLSWQDGSIRAWKPHEQESQMKWHKRLAASTHILPPEPVDVIIKPEHQLWVEQSTQIYQHLVRQAL